MPGISVGQTMVRLGARRQSIQAQAFSAATFSLSSLSGMVGWYKADALVLSDTDPVSTWTDSSGHGNDLIGVGGARPLYRTNQINSLPAVVSDGSDDCLAAGDLNPLSVIIVGKNLTGGDGNGRFWSLTAAGDAGLYDAAGTWGYFANEAGGVETLTDADTSFCVVSVVYESASVAKGYVNGTLKVTFDPKDTYASGLITVLFGSTGSGDDSVKASIPEAVLSTTALTDSERLSAERALGTKYAITVA